MSEQYIPKPPPSQKLTSSSTIHIGKYGSFQANHIIGRPFHLTYEILDQVENDEASNSGLRIVPVSELYANIHEDEISTPSESEGAFLGDPAGGVQYDIVGEDGQVVMRTNRKIIDDTNSQGMTMEEIETLKASGAGSGKELVTKILESHSALDQKTAFALAKYTLRKTKKYLKRFTVLPLDVAMLAKWILHEKEAGKVMEIREEILALIGSWSNIHYTPTDSTSQDVEQLERVGRGRWLVVDDTTGLLTAYMAEKMGVLYPRDKQHPNDKDTVPNQDPNDYMNPDITNPEEAETLEPQSSLKQDRQGRARRDISFSAHNTLTVIHPLSQPNLSLLRYFAFDPFNPIPSHPLTTHLKTLSWLQLLDPIADAGYKEPSLVSPTELANWKSSKRSTYFRKQRRWSRIRSTVDETRLGVFDGLVVASAMNPQSILHHLVPLLRGSAQVVVYSPHLEPLAELADAYSAARKSAFLSDPPAPGDMPTEDFPLDPRLLLAPTIQTARARSWQVLPGRTHPLMTGKGGAEGFVFTGTRVLPAEGKVEARGNYKRRKADEKGANRGPEGCEDAAANREGEGNLGADVGDASSMDVMLETE